MNYVIEEREGARGRIDGREVVIFSTNDYLSLSSHPDVKKAAIEALKRYGAGTGGAPGTTGTTSLHVELTKSVAEFKSRETAVLFPSGYQANIAIHHSLGAGDCVLMLDKRHHPSAVDGARLPSGAKLVRFDHHDIDSLEKELRSREGQKCVVSLPSVFTVDGDIAPLDELVTLKERYEFVLVIDEAHATGCLGETGRGLEEHFGLKGTADFVMGTFSKALGSSGGFVAFNEDRRGFLKSGFRQFEYSTSLSTVSVAAAITSLELLKSNPNLISALRKSRQEIVERCRAKGIEIISRESMIILIPCDIPEDLQRGLLTDGYFVIPADAEIGGEKKSCVRITANAAHTARDIDGFAESLGRHVNKIGNSKP